jgi:hypothetical protein
LKRRLRAPFYCPRSYALFLCGEFLKESMRIPTRYEQIIRLILCGLVLLASPVFAADKVLDASSLTTEPLSLTAYFSVLEDPSRALSLVDVQHCGAFADGARYLPICAHWR